MINNKIKKSSLAKKILARTTIAISFLIIFIFASIQGLTYWLNTAAGTNWIESQIQTILYDTPYKVTIKNFKQSKIFAISAEQLDINYSDKPILQGHNVGLSVGLFSLFNKTIHLKLHADELTLISLPREQTDQKTSDNVNNIPNLYFNKFSLSSNINKLSISKTLLGQDLSTNFRSNHYIKLSANNIESTNTIRLSKVKSAYRDYIPRSITTDLNLNIQSTQLSIHNLEVQNKNFDALLIGTYNFTNGNTDAKLNLTISKSFKDIPPIITNNLEIGAKLNGPLNDIKGNININTALKDHTLLIQTPLSYTNSIIGFNKVNGALDNMPISGNLGLNTSSGLIQGKIKVILDDLKPLKTIMGDTTIKGKGNIEANFIPRKGQRQQVNLNGDFINLHYDTVKIQSTNIKSEIKDLYHTVTPDITILAKDFSYADIKIESLGLDVKKNNSDYNFLIKANEYGKKPFFITSLVNIIDFKQNNIQVKSLVAEFNKSTINISGAIKQNNLNFNIDLTKLNLSNLPLLNYDNSSIAINKGSLSLTGTLEKPVIDSQFELSTNISTMNSTIINTALTYTDKNLKAFFTGRYNNSPVLNGNLSLPFNFSLQPFTASLPNGSPINGNIKSNLSLESITQGMFINYGINISGHLESDLTLNGTVNNPLLNGIINLNNGSFFDSASNIKLKSLNGKAIFDKDTLSIQSLTATAKNKGEFNMLGTIKFIDLIHPKFDLRAKLKAIKIIESKMVTATSDADISFISDKSGYILSGKIEPSEVMLDLTDVFNQSIPELNIISPENKDSDTFNRRIKLDLTVDTKNRVFVRGLGLDAELGGTLVVSGFANEPDIQGKLSSLRGRFEEFGKQFSIKQANLLFQGKIPPSPYVDIIAQTRSNGILAKIGIKGYIEKPELTLLSEPSLPQDQILARMMFGQDLRDVSPLQALQITQSIRKLSGKSSGSSFDPLGKLRSITKLDDITVEGVGTEDTKVGAGKYLSDKIYVKIEQGKSVESGIANVEVEVTNNIYLDSKMGANGTVGAGISWGWDY